MKKKEDKKRECRTITTTHTIEYDQSRSLLLFSRLFFLPLNALAVFFYIDDKTTTDFLSKYIHSFSLSDYREQRLIYLQSNEKEKHRLFNTDN